MKTIFSVIALSLVLLTPTFAGGQVKEVCKQVTAKNGTQKQQCKKIKVHKKLDGTKIPEKRKK